MSVHRRDCGQGVGEFFRLILGHDNLANYYTTTFALVQDHKFTISELENLIPWERLIYLTLVEQRVQRENERIKQLNAQRNRR